jgi:integrase
MTERAKTGGSIRKMPGRELYQGRYVAADGHRRSVYAATEKECQEELRKALTLADNGIRPADSKATVAEYLAEWLEASVAPRLRPRTVESYRETVKLYLVPAIGKVKLSKLTPDHVARMLAELRARRDAKGKQLSPTTVRYAGSVLRIALNRALKQGRVLRNAAALADLPAKESHELVPLSGAEVRKFLASVENDRLGTLFLAAVGTGLRQGELLALRWSDLDLTGKTLTVAHTLRRNTRELAEPKTRRSRRTLALTPAVVAGFKRQKRRQAEEQLAAGPRWRDQDFVFTGGLRRGRYMVPDGRPLDAGHVLRHFQAALKAAGLPAQPFHALRHAYATLLLEQGEELAVVSQILGHSNFSTTSDVYAHFTRKLSESAAVRMDAVLAPKGSAQNA